MYLSNCPREIDSLYSRQIVFDRRTYIRFSHSHINYKINHLQFITNWRKVGLFSFLQIKSPNLNDIRKEPSIFCLSRIWWISVIKTNKFLYEKDRSLSTTYKIFMYSISLLNCFITYLLIMNFSMNYQLNFLLVFQI